jgi:7-cyano-7-deazaguanine synthase
MMKKAIVLLSGGMDSAVTISIAKEMGFEIAALHLNYGQLTQEAELRAFERLCKHFSITEKLIVDIRYLVQIGGSSLTDSSFEVKDTNPAFEGIPNTYVPFRNANILSIATSWAEVLGAEGLFIGANQVDSSGYPDTRDEFFSAYEKMIDLGTKPETKIKIYTPIIRMSKKEIVEKGLSLKTPLELTWSCYRDNETACGNCDSCTLRLKGYEEAGIADPITYKS